MWSSEENGEITTLKWGKHKTESKKIMIHGKRKEKKSIVWVSVQSDGENQQLLEIMKKQEIATMKTDRGDNLCGGNDNVKYLQRWTWGQVMATRATPVGSLPKHIWELTVINTQGCPRNTWGLVAATPIKGQQNFLFAHYEQIFFDNVTFVFTRWCI